VRPGRGTGGAQSGSIIGAPYRYNAEDSAAKLRGLESSEDRARNPSDNQLIQRYIEDKNYRGPEGA
jgi:transposase InsO family protein